MAERKIILEVQNLTKYFDTPRGKLHAVDGVNFTIEEGKTLGIVGESGCGKSTSSFWSPPQVRSSSTARTSPITAAAVCAPCARRCR